MKLGYASSIVKRDVLVRPELDLSDYFKEISSIGYKSCGVFSFHGQAGYPDYLTRRDREELRAVARSLGVEVAGIGAYGGMLLTTEFAYFMDSFEMKYAVSYMKKCVDLAVDLDCRVVEDLAGVKPEGVGEETAWTRLLGCVKEICDYAQDRDVSVAIEHLGLVDAPEKFLKLAEQVRSEALKCVYDPSNMLKYLGHKKSEILWGIRLNAEYIVDVHLKGVSKNFQFVRPLGEEDYYGQLDFIAALKGVGYDGSVIVEEFDQHYVPSTVEKPFEAARLACEDVGKVLRDLNQ